MKPLTYFLILFHAAASAQTIQNFSLTNVSTGKAIELKNYSPKTGIVVVFTSITCPFDQYYLDRIKAIADTYSENIQVLMINSNTEKEESVAAMKSYATQNNLTLPYLADKDQSVLKMFDAKKSSEAFLLKNTGGNYSIVYRGAIDDNAQAVAEVTKTYLSSAIDQLLAKEKITVNTVRPVGCNIRRN